MKKLTHGSLFSGIGVFDLAAEKTGFTNVFACETDTYCRLHLEEHFPSSQLFGDITEVKNVPHVNFLSFGFPCQDVSIANPENKFKDALRSKRTGLFFQAVRLIRESKPDFIVVENVKNLLNNGLEKVLRELTESGYYVGYTIIPACEFGALHCRERIFIIANRHCFGWHTTVRILKQVLTEGPKQKRLRRPISDSLLASFRQETEFEGLRKRNGSPELLFDGLATKAIGNSIYYPIAEAITRQIKKELELL